MLYQDYKNKINKRVKIRRLLRRYRVPIISAISLIIILIVSFMTTKGMVFDDSLENVKIEYGNKPSFTASAVFSDVRYEFSRASENNWTTTIPVLMGDYKMRIVSNGVFGERYSSEQFFSIVPRKISVVTNTPSVVYGENPSVTASLAFDDSVVCSKFVFEDRTMQQTNVTPVKEAVRVIDKNGEDVTECYDVFVESASITFTKRDITLTVGSVNIDYNNEYFSHEVWEVTDGSLAFDDDVVKIVDKSFTSEKEVGDFENKGEFRVLKGNVDITHHYNITQKSGVLTINPRPVKVYTNDVEKTYTGQEWYDISFDVDETTPLLDGHEMTVSSWNKLATVGEVANAHGFIISDKNENDNDVTSNYCITCVSGKIKVLPREIEITTETVEVEYDGVARDYTDCTVKSKDNTFKEALVVGHSLELTATTVVKNVIENQENVISHDIVDENGNSVLSNYSVTYINGSITITKKPITIVSGTLDGIYSGRAQGAESIDYDIRALCEGHSVDPIFMATVTDCSDKAIDNEFEVTISDSAKQPVTENYEITKVFGTLKLRPLQVSVLTGSAHKIYDGTPLYEHSFEYIDGSAEFVNGQSVKYENATELTNVDTVDNVFEIRLFSGEDEKSFNYEISYEYGELDVERRPIIIKSYGFSEKVYYDGEKHRNEEYEIIPAEGLEFALVDGHDVTVEFLDESYIEFAYDGAEKENLFNIIEIKDSAGDDVTGNYAPLREYGILRLEKRPIIFVSGSIEEGAIIYDGEAHSLDECFAQYVDERDLLSNMGLVEGHVPEGIYYNSIIDAEEIDNEFIVAAIIDRGGNNTIGNYDIKSYVYGKLRVAPRPIILISQDDSKTYDGTPLENVNYSVGGMGLVTGERLNYSNNATLTDVLIDDNSGSVIGIPNSFEFGVVGGRNRKENYIVEDTEFGTLTVTKRPITLTSQSGVKVYDATPLYNTELLVGGMGTAVGQRVICIDYATLTDVFFDENGQVASIANTFGYKFIWNDETEVKLTNYEVTKYEIGTLEVTKRSATITVNSVSKDYDGTPLTPKGFNYSQQSGNYGILDVHTVSMTLSGSITKKGEVAIERDTPLVLQTVNGESIDKTQNYNLTVYDGSLTITARRIILKARTEEHEYTGAVIYPSFDGNDVIYAVNSELAGLGEGDTIEVVFSQGWRTELGTSTVKIERTNGWTITNEDDEDVSFCYEVVYMTNGRLTVIPRKISIKLHGNTKEYYDGAAIRNDGYTVENFLYDLGHTISFQTSGEQTDVGSSQAEVLLNTVVIKDENGLDASRYYEIVGTENGTLEVVNKRAVHITSASDFFYYDGQPHKNETYDIVDTCPVPMQRDEEFDIVFENDEMVAPGQYKNLFSATVFVSETNPKQYTTQNYDIIYDYGNIVIGGVDIEIKTEGGEKVYDGTPLTNPEVSFNCPNGIPEGLEIEVIATGSQTDAGSSENTYQIVAYLNGSPFPSESFNVLKEDLGILTVTPIHITISTESGETVYSGAPFIYNVYTSDFDGTEASKNLELSVSTARLTDIGRKDNSVLSVDLIDKNGNAVSRDNFTYSVEEMGTITMYADLITVESDRTIFYYDGTAKTHPYHKSPSGHINPNHKLVTSGYSYFTSPGEHENVFTTVDVVDEQGNSVKEFYPNIDCIYDKVTIAPREIKIEAPTIVERYENGKVIYAPNEIVLPNEFLDELNNNLYGYEYGYEIDCDMAEVAYATELGVVVEYYIPLEHFYITLNGERLDQNGFTVIENIAGYLRFSDKLVEIEVLEVNGYYDGTRLEYFEDDWVLEDGQLPEGYWLELDLSDIGLDEVGTVDFDEMLEYLLSTGKLGVYRYNAYGEIENMTDSFEFKFVGTPLTLNKAQLVLTAGSSTKVYDGNPLTNNTYTITGGGLEDGHVIVECKIVGTITEVGYELNEIIKVVIVDMNDKDGHGNPKDITDNYQIKVYDGVLKVTEDSDK